MKIGLIAGGLALKSIKVRLKSQKVPRKIMLARHQHAAEKKVLSKWRIANLDLLNYYISLFDDAKNNLVSYSVKDHARDIKTLHRRYEHEGIKFFTETLPSLSVGLLTWLETGQSSYPGFKLLPGAKHPVFLQGLFAAIYNDETSSEAVAAFGMIYQISLLCKKLKGPYPHSVLLKQAEDFVAVDQSISQIDLESECLRSILTTATAEFDILFEGWAPEDDEHMLPNPGPGATNTKVEKHLRFEPWVLYDQIDDVLSYKEWFFPGKTGHHNVPARSYRSLFKTSRLLPRSRFCQVPKTAGKSRGICIEENEMQFMQQALKNALYYRIEHNTSAAGHINFASQEVNAKYALASSRSKKHATIDMSEASDRVLRELVAKISCNQKRLRELLLGLSTRYIDFPPELGLKPLQTAKYAPMGSALCFPVMAIIHYVLVKAIILNSNIEDRFVKSKDVYVYGDDIVIPSSCTQAVYDWLPMFGMKLNQSKSYSSSYFRESCGIHAYYGVDVTPVYLRTIPIESSGADTLLSALACEEQLHYKGCFSISKLLRSRITSSFGMLPYVNWKSAVVGFRRKSPTDLAHLKTYASKSRIRRPRPQSSLIQTKRLVDCGVDYQSQEHRFRVICLPASTEESCPWMSENARYLNKLVTHSREVVVPKTAKSDLVIRWKWLLESALTTEVECYN